MPAFYQAILPFHSVGRPAPALFLHSIFRATTRLMTRATLSGRAVARHHKAILLAALDQNFLLVLAQKANLDFHFPVAAMRKQHPVQILNPSEHGLM
jgi:hypothetical protein